MTVSRLKTWLYPWRSRKVLTARTGWQRVDGDYFTKTKGLTDGQLTVLLTSQLKDDDEAMRAGAYTALLKLQEQEGRAAALAILAYALGLLAYEGAISGASISGLQIEKASYGHVALVLMSLTGLWLTALQSRVNYIRSWFEATFQKNRPSERAKILLLYPQAFWPFLFARANRGYPPDIHPKSSMQFSLVPNYLILIGLILSIAIALWLWIALAIQVWYSVYPSALASKATVILCGIMSVLSWTFPRHGNFLKHRYVHYGLTQTLSRMAEDKTPLAHWRIEQARRRMGLWHPRDDQE